MLKLVKAALLALAGLGMASAFAQNSSVIGAGSRADHLWWQKVQLDTALVDAEVKAAGVDWPGQRMTLKTPALADIPARSEKLPVTAKIGLSGAAVAKGLAKAAGVVTLWQTGSELYNIWSDFQLSFQNGQLVDPNASAPAISDGFYWYTSSAFQALTRQASCDLYSQSRGFPSGVLGTYNNQPTCKPVGTGTAYYQQKSANASCPSGWYIVDQNCFQQQPSATLSPDAIETRVANILANEGWPSRLSPAFKDAFMLPGVFPDVLAVESDPPTKLKITPAPGIELDTATVGDPIESTTTTTNPDGSTSTATTSTTTTATVNGNKIDYSQQRETTTTTRDATGVVTGTTTATTTTTATSTTPAAEGEDLECGLPGGPPCKIDETGTPEPPPDDGESVFNDLLPACLKEDWKDCFPELPDINWSFSLPTSCGVISLGAYSLDGLPSINICQFQAMFHDIMTMLWAAAGIFGAVALISRRPGNGGA